MNNRQRQKQEQEVKQIIRELKGLRRAMKSSRTVNKELSNLDFQHTVIKELDVSGKLPNIPLPIGNVNVSDLGKEENSA